MLGDGPTLDLSPSANANCLEWIEKERKRLRELGYVGRDGE